MSCEEFPVYMEMDSRQLQQLEDKLSFYKQLASSVRSRLQMHVNKYQFLEEQLLLAIKLQQTTQKLKPSIDTLAKMKETVQDYHHVQDRLRDFQQKNIELSNKHSSLQKQQFMEAAKYLKEHHHLSHTIALLDKKTKHYDSLRINYWNVNQELKGIADHLNSIDQRVGHASQFQVILCELQEEIINHISTSKTIEGMYDSNPSTLPTNTSNSISTDKENSHLEKRRWFQLGWNLWNSSREEEYLDKIEALNHKVKVLTEGVNQYELLLQKVHSYLQNQEQIEQGTSSDIKRILTNLEEFVKKEEDHNTKLSAIEKELASLKIENQNYQTNTEKLNQTIKKLKLKEKDYKAKLNRANSQSPSQNSISKGASKERNPQEYFQRMLANPREYSKIKNNQNVQGRSNTSAQSRNTTNNRQKNVVNLAKQYYPFNQNMTGATVFNPSKYSQNPYK
ncbi:hypothetical protein LS684_08655 [Cytobacillus spongiae]|uniref:hypothetical protein n=1 Tax=Cytobacillus spongiae TaxID=2901381 RepID=UPI001F1819C9|nr:hypothetical protein [Cytobacillus spongiae]UII57488.1 hypothetical protein LS684_08655 [Cytobacillus spongiae]